MGVDWAALEEAIHKSALRQARDVIDKHPDHVFYVVALDGVSAEESDRVDLPVLALNSEQALARDLAIAAAAADAADDDGDDSELEEDGEGPDPLLEWNDAPAGAHDDDEDIDTDDHGLDDDEFDDDMDDIDIDDVDEHGESFYSTRWNPPDWHWCSMELFDESATELWSQALTRVAQSQGWEATIRRYYEMLVSVTARLREELAVGRNADLIAYLSDEEHADQILRRCLTPEQLDRHFPELSRSTSAS